MAKEPVAIGVDLAEAIKEYLAALEARDRAYRLINDAMHKIRLAARERKLASGIYAVDEMYVQLLASEGDVRIGEAGRFAGVY